MKQHDELVIHITETGEIKVEDTENGITSYKRIDPSVFIECVRNSIRVNAVSSGILPEGVFSYSVGEHDRKRVCIAFPERRSKVIYEKTVYDDFPLPKLVFGFQLEKEHIVSVDLGVTEEGILKPKSKMYTYPFSNVSGFRLCCGMNKLPDIKSLHQLVGVMYFIMSMPNNNDHYHHSNSKLKLELRALFETLKDKDTKFYYTDVLKESGKTLADFARI